MKGSILLHGRQYPNSGKHLIICFGPSEFMRALKYVLIFKRCLSAIDFKYMLKSCPQYKWFLKPALMGVLSLILIRAEQELKNFQNPKCLSKLNVYVTIRKVKPYSAAYLHFSYLKKEILKLMKNPQLLMLTKDTYHWEGIRTSLSLYHPKFLP